MRQAVLLPLLLLCACNSLSYDQREALAGHQRNALIYFEGGRLDQAMGQIERGLDIDPDDYRLKALRGTVLLKQSASALSTDHQMLDEATAVLEEVYDTRAPYRHERYLLLNYALALQKQGRRHLGEELRLRGQAARAPNPEDLLAQADEQREQARDLLLRSRDLLDVLVDRGEVLRQAYSHQLQIAQDLGDDEAFKKAAADYLAQAEKDRAAVKSEIERTMVPAYEADQLRNLRSLRDEELVVRSLLAEWHYTRKNYEEALAQLDRVLELDPLRSTDYYNRGRVLMELDRLEDAKQDFRKFLAMSNLPPTSEKATIAARALDQ
jgi:tetratricopeptide (TPR) repeat protein